MKDNFLDPQHAVETGMLVGTLLRYGVGVEPVRDNEGDYTPMLWVTLDLGGEPDRAVKVMVIAAEGDHG